MTDLRKYVRVYYDDLAREFPDVYGDDALLSTWLRLLVVAEKMWPGLPEIPRSVRPRALSRLVDAGLIRLVPPHCYGIRGLDAERTRRAEAARKAANKRWQDESNAGGIAEPMPNREQAKAKDETKVVTPPPPAERGRRKNGTSLRQRGEAPRDIGENPRAAGTSTRQERESQKRGGFSESVASILRRAAAEGRP